MVSRYDSTCAQGGRTSSVDWSAQKCHFFQTSSASAGTNQPTALFPHPPPQKKVPPFLTFFHTRRSFLFVCMCVTAYVGLFPPPHLPWFCLFGSVVGYDVEAVCPLQVSKTNLTSMKTGLSV